jgi:F-box/leucine-rich repeat protein 10/11
MDKYVYHLLGRSHLDLTDELSLRLFGSDGEQKQHETALSSGNKRPHLTPQEIFGLKAIVMYIHALAVSKKNVPQLISEPIELVRDIRLVVDEHKNDELDSAVTGVPLLHWPGIKTDPGFTRLAKPPKPKKDTNRLPSFLKNEQKSSSSSAPSHLKKERVPCNICQACISPDCGRCHFCMDMPRFGGAGKLRQPCQLRLCLQPLLLPTIVCNICNLDGWFAETNLRLIE